MNYHRTDLKKRLTAFLLAVLLCAAVPFSALAEENPSSLEGETFEETELLAAEVEEPSAPSAAPVAEPVLDGESDEWESEIQDPEQDALAAAPLLVMGGHETYLKGYSGALFKPENFMTRAEVAQMLYNLLKDKQVTVASKFTDVTTGWYVEPINTLAALQVLNGYGDGTFRPTNTITRAEFVTILCRCISIFGGTSQFVDVPAGHWAYSYISAAAAAQWIHGVGDNKFEPERGIKRCEAVKVVNVALGRKDTNFAKDSQTQKFKDVPQTHWAYYEIAEAANPVDEPAPPSSGYVVGQVVRVTATSGLRLRKAPVDGEIILVLPYQSKVTVTDVSKVPWLGVKTSEGKTGFVSSEWVEIVSTPTTPTTPTPAPSDPPAESPAAADAAVSASKLNMRQYQTARLDGSVSKGLSAMRWTSSNPDVAVVSYAINYNSTEEGAMVYAKSPGTTVITFSDEGGSTMAFCSVTVTAAEPVRFAFASENSVVKGDVFNLTAITDVSKTTVNFKVVSGPFGVGTSWDTTTYKEESQTSSHGLGVNKVRVFTRSIKFSTAGVYKIRATSNGSTEYKDFDVYVMDTAGSPTLTTFETRRASNSMLDIIANFEGAVPDCEDDRLARKNPTVGHGYVVPKNTCFYNTMTKTEMWALLAEKVNGTYTSAVNTFRSDFNIKMSQTQFDALVSFVYNLGTGYLPKKTSTTMYNTFRVMLNAIAPPSNISPSNPYKGNLNVTAEKIYETPDTNSTVMISLAKGSDVIVTGALVIRERQRVWYQVAFKDKDGNDASGWMPAGSVKLSVTGGVCDLAYADSTILATNLLSFNKAGGAMVPGLLYRRNAECKIFFFGNYAEASHSNASYSKNTYGFIYPSDCKRYE